MLKRLLPYALMIAVVAATDLGLKAIHTHIVDIRRWVDDFRFGAAVVRHPVYGYGLRPHYRGGTWFGPTRYTLVTNSLGLRDVIDRDVPLSSPRPRVLIIGDSFIMGSGVPYERNLTVVAETMLDGRVEVLNAGVESYSPSIYRAKVRHLIESVGLKVDRVAVFVDISDTIDEYGRKGNSESSAGDKTNLSDFPNSDDPAPLRLPSPETVQSDASALTTFRQWLRDSSLTVHIAYLIKDVIAPSCSDSSDPCRPCGRDWFDPKASRPYGLWTVDRNMWDRQGRIGIALAMEQMEKLATFLRSVNIPLTVAVYPWPHQILMNDADSIHRSRWREWALRNNADFLDLFPIFMKSGDPMCSVADSYIQGDVHWSANGHLAAAGAFAAHIRERTNGRLP